MAFSGLAISPGWLFFLYAFLPFLMLGISLCFASRKDRSDNVLTIPESLVYLLVRFSSMISGSHFLWTLIILANQLLLAYYQLDFAKDIYYYTNVNNTNFDHLNSFHYSQIEVSYNALNSIGFGTRRLLDNFVSFDEDLLVNEFVSTFNNNIFVNGEENLISFYSKLEKSYLTRSQEFGSTDNIFFEPSSKVSFDDVYSIDELNDAIKNRKLQSTDVGSTITIAYHTKDFSNLLNFETMIHLCNIEKSIINDPYSCLDLSEYHSIFTTLFNKDCILYRPISAQVATLALPQNTRYVVDNFDINTPYNPVFFSYFKVGSCKNYLGTTIDEMLNQYAYEINNDISESNKKILLTYSSYAITKDDIYNEGFVLYYLFFAGFSMCYLLLIFSSRNFFFPAIIFFMIFFSIINSAAVLISFGFKKISLLSFVGVIVIVIYGVNYSITFSYVWRRKLNPRSYFETDDEAAFIRYKEEEFEPKRFSHIVGAYSIVAKSFLHSLILSIIFLSLLSTVDILVIKQFAIFTLMGIFSIFITFHLIAIPFWIATTSSSNVSYLTTDIDENYFWNQINYLFDQFDTYMNQYHCNFGVDSLNLCYLLFSGEERYSYNENTVVINDDLGRESKRQELKKDKSLIGRIRYYFSDQLKIYGVFMLIIICIIFISTLSTSTKKYSINFNYPPYLINKNYILRQYNIFYDFKNDFMREHHPSFLNIVISNSPVPTKAPVPSLAPTRAPTGRQPTRAPTVLIPDNLTKKYEKNYVNFYMNTCYGISSVKDGIDDVAYAKYNPVSFNNYIESLKFYHDIQYLCDYVDLNRLDLAIDPNWVKSRDCLYSQYVSMNNTLQGYPHTQADVIYELSSTSYGQGALFGFLSSNNVNMPAYICPNFTILANVSSIEDNPQYILDLKSTWELVFEKVGGINAKSFGIHQFVTSEVFTYPLINYYENTFYITYITASVVIIIVTILVFSAFDFILTFLSSFTMISMILLNFAFYFLTIESSITSVDLICFVASVVISIQFPVQLVEEYLSSRVAFESDRSDRDYHALSPVLARANLNTREAIIIRFLSIMFFILPLYTSNLIIFKRFVQLIVICDFLTIFCVIFVMPYIIALTCKTNCVENICQIEENEDEEEVEMTGLLSNNDPVAVPIISPFDSTVGLTTTYPDLLPTNNSIGLLRNNSFSSQNRAHPSYTPHPTLTPKTSQYNMLPSNDSFYSQNSYPNNTRPSFSSRTSMFIQNQNSSQYNQPQSPQPHQIPVATASPYFSPNPSSTNPMLVPLDTSSHSSSFYSTNPRLNQANAAPPTGSNRGLVRHTSTFIPQNYQNKDKSN